MFVRFFVIVAVCLSASVVPVAAAADGQGDGHSVIVAERFSAADGGNPQIVAADPVRGGVRALTSGRSPVVHTDKGAVRG